MRTTGQLNGSVNSCLCQKLYTPCATLYDSFNTLKRVSEQRENEIQRIRQEKIGSVWRCWTLALCGHATLTLSASPQARRLLRACVLRTAPFAPADTSTHCTTPSPVASVLYACELRMRRQQLLVFGYCATTVALNSERILATSAASW